MILETMCLFTAMAAHVGSVYNVDTLGEGMIYLLDGMEFREGGRFRELQRMAYILKLMESLFMEFSIQFFFLNWHWL